MTQICLHYRVPKCLVQHTNKILDDHIMNFKVLHIPCQSREQMLAIGPLTTKRSPEQDAEFKRRERAAAKDQLAGAIMVLERKHVTALQRLGEKRKYPVGDEQKFQTDAEYYLENNRYDFKESLAEYKADLQRELEEAQARYEERRAAKRGRKSKRIAASEVAEPERQGCIQDGQCSIF